MKFKILIFLSLLLVFSVAFRGGNFDDKTPFEKYSEVKIFLNSAEDARLLQINDINIEHFKGSVREGITIVINQDELTRLKGTGLRYDITIPDMDEYFANHPAPTEQDMIIADNIKRADNIDGFEYGSMGGFYTYDQVVQELDSMRLQYPNLITAKQNLGTSHNSKVIWAVKISDNPDINESATEPVIYFDGLHHAREPQGMASLMYYMYWLLENYGTNPEVTYLVNNREIYFVPVVNPDGYYYNQTTNPNGGGSWRKNRRFNNPSYGVDLNRNYPYKWGYNNSGSSPTPSSETYRGPSAGSEPETQAVIGLISNIHPKISFSMHSEAERTLNPYGYTDSSASYDIYSEFAGDFTAHNDYLYGTVYQMLAYYSNGTTRDYLESIGTYCWVIEVGGGSFWPSISQIIPVASENKVMLRYLTWAGGDFVDFQNYTVLGKGYVEKNDTLQLKIGVKNKGLSKTSKNVNVSLTTTYPNISPLVASVNYDSIQARQTKYNTSTPFKFRLTNSANLMDEITFLVSVKQENIQTVVDTIRITVGKANVLFYDNGESGIGNWVRGGNQIPWDTTFCDKWEGSKSFADSRYGNSKNSTNNNFTTANSYSLVNVTNPRLEFAMRYALETNYDYVRVQASTDNGTTWTTLQGRYSKLLGGQYSYHGIQTWVRESINLNAYIGKSVKFRFLNYTDSGLPGDGFYFDDFRLVYYNNSMTSVTNTGNGVPSTYDLFQNYPNPFNPVTTIKFQVPKSGLVSIKVYDITGKLVSELVNSNLGAGEYQTEFNASNLSSGVYYYKMMSGSYTSVKSMILIK